MEMRSFRKIYDVTSVGGDGNMSFFFRKRSIISLVFKCKGYLYVSYVCQRNRNWGLDLYGCRKIRRSSNIGLNNKIDTSR